MFAYRYVSHLYGTEDIQHTTMIQQVKILQHSTRTDLYTEQFDRTMFTFLMRKEYAFLM